MNFLLLSRMASRASSCPASRPRPDYRAPSILDPKTDSLLTEQSISPRGPGATALPLLTAIAAAFTFHRQQQVQGMAAGFIRYAKNGIFGKQPAAGCCRRCHLLPSGYPHIHPLFVFSTTIALLFRVGQR